MTDFKHPPAPWVISNLTRCSFVAKINDDNNLIAAAPELLDALVEITDWYESVTNIIDSPIIERARAAISKAKGVMTKHERLEKSLLSKVKCHLSDEELETLALICKIAWFDDDSNLRKFADYIVQQEIKRQCDAISGV